MKTALKVTRWVLCVGVAWAVARVVATILGIQGEPISLILYFLSGFFVQPIVWNAWEDRLANRRVRKALEPYLGAGYWKDRP